MGMLLGVLLFVFLLLGIIAGAAWLIDRSAAAQRGSQGR